MENDAISKIDLLIDNCTEQLISDTRALVKIKSTQGEPSCNAPFGEGPKAVTELFKTMCLQAGLDTVDYNVGIVSGSMKDSPIDVGIWFHGDIVPEGDGWDYPSYDISLYKGRMIGRGANDNKGQLVAIFNLFKIFKKLNINFNYNPAIFLGSNEENGMKDLIGDASNPYAKGFLNLYEAPKLSLVCDGGFPVGIGGKGGLNITLKSKTKFHGMTFEAGTSNAPGNATAVLDNCNFTQLDGCTVVCGEKTVIETFSPPRHGARPDPDGNMVTMLTSSLLKNRIVNTDDRYILEFFNSLSLNVYGQSLGIYTDHKEMGLLTVFIKEIVTEDGYAKITLNIRYPITITFDGIAKKVTENAEKSGFLVVGTEKRTTPYVQNGNKEIINLLLETVKEVPSYGKVEKTEPYYVEGGTYAHFLPNAYVFGSGACVPPEDFENGKGLSHGVDECVSIPRLKRSMKIYARTLLKLNEKFI